MAQLQIINIGATANDGTGDPLRVAFEKVNENFTNLWSTGFNTLTSITNGTAVQSIFEWPANLFTQATFQINSTAATSGNSQSIVINASINSDLDEVKFTAHSTTFHGNAVSTYDMDVVSGNVILYADPLVSGQMRHYIGYQVFYDEIVMGSQLILENSDTVIITENTNNVITTES